MLETSWLWFVISKEYVELTRPKIESRDPIFFTGTRLRSWVSGNDRLFPRGSEFGPNLEIPARPAIQLRPGPDDPTYIHPAPQNMACTPALLEASAAATTEGTSKASQNDGEMALISTPEPGETAQ